MTNVQLKKMATYRYGFFSQREQNNQFAAGKQKPLSSSSATEESGRLGFFKKGGGKFERGLDLVEKSKR